MDTRTNNSPTPLTAQDFASLGVGQVAYIRTVSLNGQQAFSVHAADGTPLTVLANRESALGVIVQNDMEPLSAH